MLASDLTMSDSDSSADTFATERSFEVEDLSPPESPTGDSDTADTALDHGGDHGGPEPYQFEPLAPQAAGSSEEMELQERMGDISEWCSCGHCSNLSPRENVCCKCEQIGGAACVTVHPGFEPVALNPYVLLTHNIFILHSCYRHLAYRNFVRWCWGYLGRHIRVGIPSCAVTRIRQEFPENEGNYTGFQLPPLD
uniref:P2X purinoreceptor 7 intracellular domain-containing protein n=1 Tax=Sparus aurata TaxID=8175 RepID=A0A671VER7_SPAAU